MSDIKKFLYQDFTKLNANNLARYKRRWASKLGRMHKNSEILTAYKSLLRDKKIKPNNSLENKLQTRSVRSMSGVTPFAVMTKPYPCPGQCIYCPLELGMPKSYLSDEPAAQRAKKFNFNPRLQVENRLEQLEITGHNTQKIELIIIGGTFSNYPRDYKLKFFKEIIDTINDTASSSLQEAQEINEKAKKRIVGISIETRPDWITGAEIKLLRKLGVTKVQLGVQALDDKILQKIKRGHSLNAVAKATKMLKNAGFKVCYHFMPNLPGSNPEKDLEMARLMYEDPRFKPDFVKIYPAQVIAGTELYTLWSKGEYKTYEEAEMLKVLYEIKLLTPPWVRIDRLIRDISKKWVKSGTHKTNIRQVLQKKLITEGKNCQCIRCREIKKREYQFTPSLLIRTIETQGATELMLAFEHNGLLYSLLKLRLPNKNQKVLFKELANSAIIRELHTFGQVVAVNKQEKKKTQHKGLGRKLMKKAESIARRKGYKKLAVISAIGTRRYYQKLGFSLEGLYMTKWL